MITQPNCEKCGGSGQLMKRRDDGNFDYPPCPSCFPAKKEENHERMFRGDGVPEIFTPTPPIESWESRLRMLVGHAASCMPDDIPEVCERLESFIRSEIAKARQEGAKEALEAHCHCLMEALSVRPKSSEE